MIMVDAVSEIYRCSWDRVFDMNVFEFLNIYSYVVAKGEHQKSLIEKQIHKKGSF